MLHFVSMTASPLDMRVQDIDHCGLVAGIYDQMNLVEQINRLLGTHPQEIISACLVVKAMSLNGLGFVSAPLSPTLCTPKCHSTDFEDEGLRTKEWSNDFA